jgi:hypothetical protein
MNTGYLVVVLLFLYMSEYYPVISQKGGASTGVVVGCFMAVVVIAVVIGIFVLGKKDPTPSPNDS